MGVVARSELKITVSSMEFVVKIYFKLEMPDLNRIKKSIF